MKPERVKDFILNVTKKSDITVENTNTGHYITYRLVRNNITRQLIIYAKFGFKYRMIGYFAKDDVNNIFTLVNENSKERTIFHSIVKRYIYQFNPFNDIVIHHDGCCSICNKKLTTPESIENGIGPKCLADLKKIVTKTLK